MRVLFSLLLICTLSFVTPSSANAHPQQADIDRLATNIATSRGANKHIVLSQLMVRIEGVEKAIGSNIDYRLALQIADCSDSAAHPNDPGKFGKGIVFSKIKAKEAIESCTVAYQNGGERIGLILANLSRAYNKSEDYKNSLAAAKLALSLNYPFADVLIANHYNFGDGVEKNDVEQFRWYKSAAEKGIKSAMRSTSDNHRVGKGTPVNYEQAYQWALKGVKNNDGKSFYQMGKVLEAKATKSKQSKQLLMLARQSYEIADESDFDLSEEINAVNKMLSPNRFSPHAQAFKTLSGRKINGRFVEEDNELSWYLLKTNLADKDGNVFAFARNAHKRNLLTVWYQHAVNERDSGWYISFKLTGGMTQVKSIRVTASIAGKTEYIPLDLADSQVKDNLFSNRMTGRISFRDVLLLAAGKHVRIHYKSAKKANPKYTMALNDPDIVGGVNSTQSAKVIIGELIDAARKLDKNCCNAPSIEPLSDEYHKYFKRCKFVSGDSLTNKEGIRQNCHSILKNAPKEYSLIVEPLKTNLDRVLREIDLAFKK